VVKAAAVAEPAPLARLPSMTDLKLPPDNWLRDDPVTKGFVPPASLPAGFTSFHMANDFLSTLADVDVVSDGENIKKLLKIPYSKAPVSMMVHRVGRTLLLDDFDVHRYLLRRSATEWEWIRKFFTQTIMQESSGAVVRKNASSSALQERNLVSKFLHRSLEHQEAEEPEQRLEAQLAEGREQEAAAVSLATLALDPLPPLPEPETEKSPNFSSERFARNLLWTFEDIRMLIGSNMPIFGDREHPCVSLRLRDMEKPINVLTGMDYWLDNLMCQVPEVVMCYHLDGLVQKYELVKTEDLPNFEGSKFSPKVVKNIAQNILHFLKSKAAKEGHTYWLFKGKDDDIVKLYDLTSLSQKDAGLKPQGCAEEEVVEEAEQAGGKEGAQGNPFQTPVSMLMYRLARSILETEERAEGEGTVRELLQNCVSLLDSAKFPHIATSAHFLLSELYVPEGTDPARPGLGGELGEEPAEERGEAGEQASLRVANLSLPGPSGGQEELGEARPPIKATTGERCLAALRHLAQGLAFLSGLEARREQRAREEEKARERRERENIRMSVPNTAIPMGYTSTPKCSSSEGGDSSKGDISTPVGSTPSTSVEVRGARREARLRSVSEGSGLVAAPPATLTWTEYLKFLLLKKALLVHVTLAELSFSALALGRALKCVKRAVNCFSLVARLGSPEDRATAAPAVTFALGVAGDAYLAMVARWADLPVYLEQYNAVLAAEGGIAREVERYTDELERDWTIKQPKDIREAMELAARCYTKALDLVGEGEERTSLQRRLANVENELGVFFMNQGAALVQRVGGDSEEVAVAAMAGAQDLFTTSRRLLARGVERFEGIADLPNTALLLSNSGRLERVAGHAAGLAAAEGSEVAEFGGEEAASYRAAVAHYHRALALLGGRRAGQQIWDSVTWELSSTLYTVGTLLQDHAPLTSQSREDVEKAVTEHMGQALKYIDYEASGPRQQVFLMRGATIHHRLASLYHHSYRCYGPEDPTPRKRSLRQLADLHYVKAANLFLTAERFGEHLRALLERAGLVEGALAAGRTEAARVKVLLAVLEILVEARPAVAAIVEEPDAREEGEEEEKMLETLVQRLQFTLLSLMKVDQGRRGRSRKEGLKEHYAAALRCTGRREGMAREVQGLLERLASDKTNVI